MNPKLKRYKNLTIWVEKNKIENLLEGTLYLDSAYKFITLLTILDKNKIKYSIKEGFKGYEEFRENENHFKNVILKFENRDKIIEMMKKSAKINSLFKLLLVEEDCINFVVN